MDQHLVGEVGQASDITLLVLALVVAVVVGLVIGGIDALVARLRRK